MAVGLRSRSLKNIFAFPCADIDSSVFRLHYRLTFAILLGLSILVGWRQHFGESINCISNDELPSSFIGGFCYTHSTYSKKETWEKKIGAEIPYPGVDKYPATKIYHTYYQWVSLMLFVQALFFLVPRCFWKHMESGRVHDIIKGMAKYDSVNENLREQDIGHLSRRLRSELHHNGKYFWCYVATAVLNLVNVIVQIHLMNVFLRGQFSNFGHQLLQFSGPGVDFSYSNQDPGLRLFPRLTMCDFFRYGSSGDVQKHSIMCLLPLNALNEKIYAFLWFWFVFLAVVSCIPLISLTIFFFSMRFRILLIFLDGSRLLEINHVRQIVAGCNVPNCFLIRLVSQNLSSETFRDLVHYILKENNPKIEESEMKLM